MISPTPTQETTYRNRRVDVNGTGMGEAGMDEAGTGMAGQSGQDLAGQILSGGRVSAVCQLPGLTSRVKTMELTEQEENRIEDGCSGDIGESNQQDRASDLTFLEPVRYGILNSKQVKNRARQACWAFNILAV